MSSAGQYRPELQAPKKYKLSYFKLKASGWVTAVPVKLWKAKGFSTPVKFLRRDAAQNTSFLHHDIHTFLELAEILNAGIHGKHVTPGKES